MDVNYELLGAVKVQAFAWKRKKSHNLLLDITLPEVSSAVHNIKGRFNLWRRARILIRPGAKQSC
jgi:hypothetical protein